MITQPLLKLERHIMAHIRHLQISSFGSPIAVGMAPDPDILDHCPLRSIDSASDTIGHDTHYNPMNVFFDNGPGYTGGFNYGHLGKKRSENG